MNKFEMELNEQPAKAFFVRHGEKLGLGLAVILLGLFVYLGLSMSPDLKDQTPSKLKSLASNAENRIESGDWNQLREHRRAVADTAEKLESSKVAVDADDFPFDTILARRSKAAELRKDPAMVAPEFGESQVSRVAIVGPSEKLHPLDLLKDLELSSASDDSGADRGFGGNEAGGLGRGAGAEPDSSFDALGAVAGIDPVAASLQGLAVEPKTTYLAVVKFVMPYKKLANDYKEIFKNSIGYTPESDRVIFRHLEVERRVDGGQWEDYTANIKAQETSFVVAAPNPFEDKFASSVLTRPFPPILVQSYFDWARHSKIPLLDLTKDKGDAADGESQGFGNNAGVGNAGKQNSGQSSRSSGASGRSDRDSGNRMSGRSGRDGGGGGNTTSNTGKMTVTEMIKELPEYQLIRFTDQDLKPGERYEYRVRVWLFDPNNPVAMQGSMASNSEEKANARSFGGMEGSSSSGLGGGKDGAEDQGADEFSDDVIPQSNVKLEQLTAEVRERLRLEAKMKRPLPMLANCRPTPWSEPSPEVVVNPIMGLARIASADPVRDSRAPLGGTEIFFPSREATLTAMAGIWDEKFDVQVPLKIEKAMVGNVLGGQAAARILDPIKRVYKKLLNNEGLPEKGTPSGYRGSTGIVLVDFMGGNKIENVTESRNDFKVPTEALLLDAGGNLMVANSDSDARDYTWLSGEVLTEEGVARRQQETGDDGGEGDGKGAFGGGGNGRSSRGSAGGSGRSDRGSAGGGSGGSGGGSGSGRSDRGSGGGSGSGRSDRGGSGRSGRDG